jgi:hypothetical protein
MYGTVNCIDMDANQNGQHVTLQVTIKKIKNQLKSYAAIRDGYN